jgi:hypothetical protein
MTMLSSSPASTPTDAGPVPPAEDEQVHGHHRRRWVIGGLMLLLAIVAGGVVGLFLLREDPGAKDVTEAVDEYRATSQPTTPGIAGAPNPGVYLAAGQGHEELSFPPVAQDDGATMPLTVEPTTDGCWTVTVDFNEAHWQSWEHCATGGEVFEQGGQTFQRWDLGATTVENLADFGCEPPILTIAPAARPGESWQQSCTGTNSSLAGTTTSAGPYTFVGLDELEIDGRIVAARHYRQERDITGAQEGSNDVDWWFTVDEGLPVRMERTIEVATASPFGDITYEESGEWQLTALEPVS